MTIEQQIVEELYKNLQSLFARFLELQKELLKSTGDLYQSSHTTINDVLEKAKPENRKLSANDKIRSYVYVFDYFYKFFPEYRKILFKYYKEAPKKSGNTYAFIREVDQYCKMVEPKILKL